MSSKVLLGAIRTMDPTRPTADAMLVVGDRITAIGSVDEVRAATSADHVEEHFDGVLMPGFIDAHMHLQRAGLKALQLLGDDADADELSAIMRDDARGPDWRGESPPTIEQRVAGLVRVQPLLHAMGFTGAIDPAVTIAEMRGYQAAWEREVLTLRVVAMPYPPIGTEAVPGIDEAIAYLDGVGVATGFGDDMLRLGPIKVYYDGEGMKGQALLAEPWDGHDHGVQRLDAADFRRLAEFCAVAGWGMGVHAVGSRAIEEVLDGFEHAASFADLEPLRCQLIHAYLEPSADSMERAARLGVIASLQPSIAWNNAAGLIARLGDRALDVNPMRSWLDAGVRLALGSDGPFFPFDPRANVDASVTRQMDALPAPIGLEQAITVPEALAGYTTGASYASMAEDRRGMLRTGYLADWTRLDVDPLVCSAEEFRAARVLQTVVGGRTVFTA